MRVASKPVCERVVARHLWIKCVGVARRDYFVNNFPDRVAIRIGRSTNVDHLTNKALTTERSIQLTADYADNADVVEAAVSAAQLIRPVEEAAWSASGTTAKGR